MSTPKSVSGWETWKPIAKGSLLSLFANKMSAPVKEPTVDLKGMLGQ